MRKLITSMWSITTPIVPGEELQILAKEDGLRAMLQLWLKLLLAFALFLGPLLLLKIDSIKWLEAVLAVTAVSFSVAPIIISGDMSVFYYLPGIRLTDDGFWIKKAKSTSIKFYSYQELVQIQQLTSADKKMTHQVQLVFSDGSSWSTNKRPNSGVPFLIHLTDELKKRCNCAVWPEFDEEFTSEKPASSKLINKQSVDR